MTNDTKIIIAALILIGLIAAAGWYFHWWEKKEVKPTAFVSETASDTSTQVPPASGIIVGKDEAPVTIIEYTNFLCSHCADFALKTLPQIEEKYIKTGQVKLEIFVFPPLEIGQAVLCSQEQNKSLEYHNYLFEHQEEITKVDDLKTLAQNAGMDKDKFEKCLDSEKYKEIAANWSEEGQKKGVDGTPTFFIGLTSDLENAEKIVGAQPLENFEQAIQKYLYDSRRIK